MNNNGIPARAMAGGHRKKDSARIVWDSKPRRAPNPKDIEFQTAEVVIPNPETAGQLPMSFRDTLLGPAYAEASAGREEELDLSACERAQAGKQKMNRLIWGDNLLAMQALLNQGYEGKINLIYIDPPFDSKADYSHKIKLSSSVIPAKAGIQSQDFEFTKEPSVIERLAYKDTWAGGTDSYLDMLYPRLQLMKRLLAPDGSIYVHLDWHVGHYVKVMMDEIFGKDNFRNELIWKFIKGASSNNTFGRKHQNIFFYSKNDTAYFDLDSVRVEYNPETIARAQRGEARYQNIDPDELNEKGKNPGDVWDDIFPVQGNSIQNTGYNTQKPEKLFERIIQASSREDDLIADFFAGSGTTLAVAEKLNRRWIGCELGKVGIQVARARLVEQKSKPFLIENIGNYQREMIYFGGARIYEMQKIILKLYGAEPMANRKDLGVRLPAPRRPNYLVYAIRCDNDSIYIGQTSDLFRRWEEHRKGRARWTAAHKPIEIIHHEEFATREEAEERERWLKTGFGRKWIKRELQADRLKKWDHEAARRAGQNIDGIPAPQAGRELVYCGYPDRAVAAHKVEDLAIEATTLDGAGYKRLVILAWDYEYNYDELLQTRIKAAGKDLKTEIISRQIPPDIYEYLKQAKSEEDIERLSDKVKFLEKPYLRLRKAEVKGNLVTIGIEKYVLYDFPLGSGKKADEDREQLLHLVKDNFAVLIDYWAVDWDYDGLTFKSQWQDLRGLGRKTKIVTTEKDHIYEKAGKHTIAVRVVDIFGNDATATIEVKL